MRERQFRQILNIILKPLGGMCWSRSQQLLSIPAQQSHGRWGKGDKFSNGPTFNPDGSVLQMQGLSGRVEGCVVNKEDSLQTTSATVGESILSDYSDANAKRVRCVEGKVCVKPDQGGLLRDVTDGGLEADGLQAGVAEEARFEGMEEAEMLKCDPLLCKMASDEVKGKGSNHRFNI